jgi:hypothetical protein
VSLPCNKTVPTPTLTSGFGRCPAARSSVNPFARCLPVSDVGLSRRIFCSRTFADGLDFLVLRARKVLPSSPSYIQISFLSDTTIQPNNGAISVSRKHTVSIESSTST